MDLCNKESEKDVAGLLFGFKQKNGRVIHFIK
jgi:hypothetical protein